MVRETHHGPIVNEALRADDAEPLALRFMALDFPGLTRASLGMLDFASGADLVEAVGEHAHPVSNLVWADRHGSIGYKTVGRLPVRRGGCPDLPKPGWTGEHEWDGWVPYEEMPELTDPERASWSRPTTGSPPRTIRTTSPATTWTATGRAASSS